MESTVAEKLESLNKLQAVDSKLDEIKKIRGALPEEVMDLEDEIAGYETRVQKHNDEVADLELAIANNKTAIKEQGQRQQRHPQPSTKNNDEFRSPYLPGRQERREERQEQQ